MAMSAREAFEKGTQTFSAHNIEGFAEVLADDVTTPSSPASGDRRAVVIGASIAGLLAARVLSDRYDEVVLLERDPLSENAAARKGTPHAIHPHGLLARGNAILEELFPGFTAALIGQGALTADIGYDVALEAQGYRFARASVGVSGLAVSRLSIEAELRRRVRARANVRLVTGMTVLAPVHERGQVTGVRFHPAEDASAVERIPAALVVDCTGRGSRTPTWLREWGYEPPAEEAVKIGIAYTSAYFRRHPGIDADLRVVIGTATPAQPKPFVLIAQEPDAEGQPRWVMAVGGYEGDHVAVSLDAIQPPPRY